MQQVHALYVFGTCDKISLVFEVRGLVCEIPTCEGQKKQGHEQRLIFNAE